MSRSVLPRAAARLNASRVLAVDAGSRCVRVLLLENWFGQLRLRRHQTLDLHEEGLVAADELKAHLQSLLELWGRPPIALALPQLIAVAQSVELPLDPQTDPRQLIAGEIVKLRGASDSAIAYDFARLPARDPARARFWVSFCQETELRQRIAALGLEHEDFRDLTPAANALFTAWNALHPDVAQALLVHAGAQETILLLVQDGVAVFADAFSGGGQALTRALAQARGCPEPVAEALQRKTNLFTGGERVPELQTAVRAWFDELQRQLADDPHARRLQETGDLARLPVFVSGGFFEAPGLLEWLRAQTGWAFEPWRSNAPLAALLPERGYEIALGAALQALGEPPQPISLLPEDLRTRWRARRARQRLELASAGLLLAGFVALGFALAQNVALIREKTALRDKVEAALETVEANRALTVELLDRFDIFRPLFERQQFTQDTLHTLRRLDAARGDQNFWCVLIADQTSYFSHPPAGSATNPPAPATEPLRARAAFPAATNPPPARPGYIAEVCVPDDLDNARRLLSALVNDLKKDAVFARVDLLSEDLRRPLADPKVLLPDRHFAIALDFAATEFQPPPVPRRPRAAPPPRATRTELRAAPAPLAPGDRATSATRP
ncbi:MAG: hypothetical protein N3I86_09485 [Verrucomicrobiae bacterium]|nr:hypothetical protein [Verrucomicrobiae bacterium]MDW8309667.1 hypothetical protein [Verrucomicrobiales bacterium]